MIREATERDIPKIMEMGHSFVQEMSYPLPMEVDEDSLQETLAGMLESDDAVIFVNDEVSAMFGGILAPFYFNKNEYAAQELFWWVSPEARNSRTGLKLLSRFEEWATKQGAYFCIMNYMENGKSERLGRFFEHRGYKLADYAYARAS